MHGTVEKLLPEEVNGWTSAKEDNKYNKETIFQYLDGGAELYLAYNMEELFSRRFKLENETDIVVDLFQMKSAKDAFGVFSHDYRGNELNIGNGSVYESGLLTFWKGNYYVTVLAEIESPQAKEAVMKIGKLISNNITSSASPPEIVNKFPEKVYKLKAVHYFNNHRCLNIYYFLSNKNILNLTEQTEGALAEYNVNGKPVYSLLVDYKSNEAAQKGFKNFLNKVLEVKSDGTVVTVKDGKWYCAGIKGNYFVAVLKGSTKEEVKRLMETILAELL